MRRIEEENRRTDFYLYMRSIHMNEEKNINEIFSFQPERVSSNSLSELEQ